MHASRLIASGLAALALTCATAQAEPSQLIPARLLDKPVRVVHVPLPKDPLNPDARPEVACFYYSGMMVKQVIGSGKGVDSSSYTALGPDAKAPQCSEGKGKGKGKGERPIDWEGLFLGARKGLLFFEGTDGLNEGNSFAIFSESTHIFEDTNTALTAIDVLNPAPSDTLRHSTFLRLRYDRLLIAPCSLVSDPKGCWKKLQLITGLTEPTPPNCTAHYEEGAAYYPPEQRKEIMAGDSVIKYGVEVVLNVDRGIVRITPTTRAKDCWPAP